MTTPTAPPRIHVLAKPTGAICNLDCSYCFFLDKEQLYPGSNFRMTDEVLEAYIRQLIESHRSNQVTVAWQGGEPTLMGIPFFDRVVELQEKYARPGLAKQHPVAVGQRPAVGHRQPEPMQQASAMRFCMVLIGSAGVERHVVVEKLDFARFLLGFQSHLVGDLGHQLDRLPVFWPHLRHFIIKLRCFDEGA